MTDGAFDKSIRPIRLKLRGGLQSDALVAQTGEVYKPARPGPELPILSVVNINHTPTP